MKNFWKQFMGLATGLKSDLVSNTRFKLSSLFIITIAALAGVVYAVTQPIQDRTIRDKLLALPLDTEAIKQITESLIHEIHSLSISAYVSAVTAVGVLCFVLVGLTLRPIRRALEQQKRFLADVSHELRTPLSIIKTNTEVALLSESTLKLEDAITTIKGNLDEVNRMAEMFELALAQFQTNTMPFTRFNVASVIHHAISMVQPGAKSKHIEILPNNVRTTILLGNPTALEEVFVNLLNNAIYYTPIDGTITVDTSISTKSKLYSLSIKDTGVGIPHDLLTHMFEPAFRRPDQNPQRKKKSGLGLIICKQIIDRHKGTLVITSEINKGTVVTVNLPFYYYAPTLK